MLSRSETKAILRYLDNLLRSNRLNSVVRKEVCEWAIENGTLFPGLVKDWVFPDEHKRKETVQYSLIKHDVAIWLEKYGEVRESASDKTMRSLVRLFGLNKAETSLLALLIRGEKYGFLQDLFQRVSYGRHQRGTYGTLDTIENCAILTGFKLQDIMKAVQPQGRLCSCGLLTANRCQGEFEVSQAVQFVFQTGVAFSSADKLRDVLAGKPHRSSLSWDDFVHLGEDRELLEVLLGNAVQRREKGINILLYGRPGTGKTEFCKTLADRLGLSLYAAAETDEHGEETSRTERLQSLRMLQAMLSHTGKAAIMLDEAEDVFGYAMGSGSFSSIFSNASTVRSKVFMNRLLENNPLPVFWLSNSVHGMDKAFIRRMSYCLEFAEIPAPVRLRMSIDACRQNGLAITREELAQFAREYDVVPSVISNAARVANIDGGGFPELRRVVERQEKLLGGKKRMECTVEDFSTALLNTDLDLVRITQSIVQKRKENFSFCLFGPPGTGKSEYARWLASQMEMEVILKRASDLLSKWVGGTEENIAQAFNEARAQHKLLIFDEADSLLQSRREARASWEISHVNEMLTWMERHPLPFVCTTNLSERLDEASFRRFTFKVRFDFLSKMQIADAFRQFFGLEAPPDVLAFPSLTPGDFAVVRKKVEYFDSVSAEEIGKMLVQEVAVKSNKVGGHRLGFLTG